MEQQQNKHSSKNYKRNSKPAKLISSEFAIIDKDGVIKANFNTIEEVKQYKEEHKEKTTIYNIKVYKLNAKQIKLTQKI